MRCDVDRHAALLGRLWRPLVIAALFFFRGRGDFGVFGGPGWNLGRQPVLLPPFLFSEERLHVLQHRELQKKAGEKRKSRTDTPEVVLRKAD